MERFVAGGLLDGKYKFGARARPAFIGVFLSCFAKKWATVLSSTLRADTNTTTNDSTCTQSIITIINSNPPSATIITSTILPSTPIFHESAPFTPPITTHDTPH